MNRNKNKNEKEYNKKYNQNYIKSTWYLHEYSHVLKIRLDYQSFDSNYLLWRF